MDVQWEGVMPALTTQFDETDRLDLLGFEKKLQAQLEAGVSGIILGGTLGEASTLSLEEKDILTRRALELVGGKVPVILNIAEARTSSAVQAAKRAAEIGVDGLMLLPPMRYRPTRREALAYLEAVARSTSLPIMVYNNPVDYGTEVTLDMFEALLEACPNIRAVKESTRDVSNVTRIKNHFGERLKVLCGVDTLAMESLLMGADGWVAGLVCAFPRETVAVYALCLGGEVERALEIYRWFLPLLELDISPQLVQNIKLAETLTGLGSEAVRAPRLPLVGAERDRVISIVESALKERPVLPEYLKYL